MQQNNNAHIIIDGNYDLLVTRQGEVYHNGIRLSPMKEKNGYMRVTIHGRKYLVHRLVASAYIEPLVMGDRHRQVHHVNNDKTDNCVTNLVVMNRDEHQRMHKTKYPKTKLCLVCGKEFTPAPTKRKRAKTCSAECFHILQQQLMTHRGIRIAQYDTDGKLIKIWDTASDAARHEKINRPNLTKCLNGEIQTCGGYVWKRM